MKLISSFIVLMFVSGIAVAKDSKNWQTSEHNFNIKSGKWGLNVRTYNNDDYDHVEGSYKLGNGFTAALRYAEDGTNTEIRPKLSHKVWSNDNFAIGHRLEYRYFEGTKDDKWRYRAIVGLKAGGAWIKVQPRWTFGGGTTGDTNVDDVKWQSGYDFTLSKTETNKITFTPYVEYLTTGYDPDAEGTNWDKKHVILGTNFTVKF